MLRAAMNDDESRSESPSPFEAPPPARPDTRAYVEALSTFRMWAAGTLFAGFFVPVLTVGLLDSRAVGLGILLAIAYVPSVIALAVASLRRYGRLSTDAMLEARAELPPPTFVDRIAAVATTTMVVLLVGMLGCLALCVIGFLACTLSYTTGGIR